MQENKVTDIAPEDLDRLGLLIEQGQLSCCFQRYGRMRMCGGRCRLTCAWFI